MKIILANDYLGRSKGGIEAWIYHAAEALRDSGHEPVLLGFKELTSEDAAPEGIRIAGIDSRKYRIPGFSLWRNYKYLQKELRKIEQEIKPDVWWIRSALMAGAAVKNMASPVVFVHAANFPEYTRIGLLNQAGSSRWRARWNSLRCQLFIRMAYLIERRALCYSSANVYLSKARQAEIADYYGNWMLQRSHVIPPGADLLRFHPAESEPEAGILRVVSVCRLVQDKNLQQVIRAVALLRRNGHDVQYRIAGEGPYACALQDLTDSLGLNQHVKFIGKCEQVEDLYRWGDVFALPSVYEGFGNVYPEALASGLPCIALRPKAGKYLVATDEIIDHGQTGLLLEDDRPESLADALKLFSEDRGLLRAMKKNARSTAEQRYSWRRCVEALMALTEK